METKTKVGQIWKDKTTGDRVKVIKILPGYVRILHMDGENQGKQESKENYQLVNKFRLVQDV